MVLLVKGVLVSGGLSGVLLWVDGVICVWWHMVVCYGGCMVVVLHTHAIHSHLNLLPPPPTHYNLYTPSPHTLPSPSTHPTGCPLQCVASQQR